MDTKDNTETHTDEQFNDRVSAIANRIGFGADPNEESDPLEVAAAKLLLSWEIEK